MKGLIIKLNKPVYLIRISMQTTVLIIKFLLKDPTEI